MQYCREHSAPAAPAGTFLVSDQYEVLRDAIAGSQKPWFADGVIRVPTTTLFPSGELISLTVVPTRSGRFRVSDDGLGRTAVLDEGVHHMRPGDRKRAEAIADFSGLRFEGEAFVADDVSADNLASAMALVAEASRSWAAQMLDRSTRNRERALFEVVKDKLERAYSTPMVHSKIAVLGASSSQYDFDFGVKLNSGRFALFEIISPAPPSVAFAHTKFSDVQRAQPDWPREAVVEDLNAWPSESLALISQVTSHVRPASADWKDLPLMAA